jgi:hypothetical protein
MGSGWPGDWVVALQGTEILTWFRETKIEAISVPEVKNALLAESEAGRTKQ